MKLPGSSTRARSARPPSPVRIPYRVTLPLRRDGGREDEAAYCPAASGKILEWVELPRAYPRDGRPVARVQLDEQRLKDLPHPCCS